MRGFDWSIAQGEPCINGHMTTAQSKPDSIHKSELKYDYVHTG